MYSSRVEYKKFDKVHLGKGLKLKLYCRTRLVSAIETLTRLLVLNHMVLGLFERNCIEHINLTSCSIKKGLASTKKLYNSSNIMNRPLFKITYVSCVVLLFTVCLYCSFVCEALVCGGRHVLLELNFLNKPYLKVSGLRKWRVSRSREGQFW